MELENALIKIGYIENIPYVISQNRRLYLGHPNSRFPDRNHIVRCSEDSPIDIFLGAIRANEILLMGKNNPSVYLNGEPFSIKTWLELWSKGLLKLPEKTKVDDLDLPRLNFKIRKPLVIDILRPRKNLPLVKVKNPSRDQSKTRGGITEYLEFLPDDFPMMKYSEKVAKTLESKNVHMGQDKLLFSEIEFLVSLGAPKKKILVIYPGGGPGTHLPLLASITGAKIVAIDPAFNNKSLSPISPSDDIVIFPKLFDVTEWLNLSNLEGFDDIILISDIRSEPKGVKKGTKEYSKKFDDEIKANMKLQKDWFNQINSTRKKKGFPLVKGLFKFRLTWESGSTNYLSGPLAFQVFEKASSTEMRLWASDLSTKNYDHRMMEEKLFFFNSQYRTGSFLDIDPVFGISYDLLKASKIIKGLLLGWGAKKKDLDQLTLSFFLYLDDFFSKHRKPYYGKIFLE